MLALRHSRSFHSTLLTCPTTAIHSRLNACLFQCYAYLLNVAIDLMKFPLNAFC